MLYNMINAILLLLYKGLEAVFSKANVVFNTRFEHNIDQISMGYRDCSKG